MLVSFGILNGYALLSAVIASRFPGADKIRPVNCFFGGMLLLLARLLLIDGKVGVSLAPCAFAASARAPGLPFVRT